MKWSQQANPRVMSTTTYYAFAHDNPGEQGGFVANVYKTHEGGSSLASRWGGTKSAALRAVIKAFDPDAQLPREEVPR